MERFIFLDIDGVCNRDDTPEYTPMGYVGLDSRNLTYLKNIIDASGAKIVLTSTWRASWDPDYEKCDPDGKYMVDRFKEFGLEIFDKIPGWSLATRGHEIDTYVKSHKLESWIVIDDEYFFDFSEYGITTEGETPNLLLTDYKLGLNSSDVERVKYLFGMSEFEFFLKI